MEAILPSAKSRKKKKREEQPTEAQLVAIDFFPTFVGDLSVFPHFGGKVDRLIRLSINDVAVNLKVRRFIFSFIMIRRC